MFLQQCDNFFPALLPTPGFCFRVFGRSPRSTVSLAAKNIVIPPYKTTATGNQESGSHYYNAGWIGGQAGHEAQRRPPHASEH